NPLVRGSAIHEGGRRPGAPNPSAGARPGRGGLRLGATPSRPLMLANDAPSPVSVSNDPVEGRVVCDHVPERVAIEGVIKGSCLLLGAWERASRSRQTSRVLRIAPHTSGSGQSSILRRRRNWE